jgi:TolB-like protein/DNA-binding winged helix-turn-helix (wHTH) protein
MAPTNSDILRIGTWRVDPLARQISRDGEAVRVEERTMRLLLCLAGRACQVVSIDDLLSEVWAGVNVSPDSVYQAVASLRRMLGDDAKEPTYIATVPRLGYRMVARVSRWHDSAEGKLAATSPSAPDVPHLEDGLAGGSPRRQSALAIATGLIVGLVLVAGLAFWAFGRFFHSAPTSSVIAAQPQKSIAVLPFLDLTEGMREETFADGMTEELIDKLSKIPNLRVPAPTSSFYFKGKQIPVAEIAKSLGVSYILDGSVRKSGDRLRVAARLVRAENGYVIWSETYDRPFDDILMVQDDIAGEATKALKSSIDGKP